ncbi:hypothetical protein JW998_08540 [candidate division KSB1 bacterium]|nr:hypothetical protein [candidate division KSB1 bacterium]
MKVKLVFLVLGLAVVMMFGCAKAPQQAVDAAKAALEAAKTAEVDRYFADQYKAAHDSLSAALAEIDMQNTKSAASRNYSKAKKLLASTTNVLNEVMPQIEAKKAEVKSLVDTLIVKTQTELGAVKGLIAMAPRGRESKAVLDDIQSRLSTCETSLLEVNAVVEKGDLVSAHDQLKGTMEKLLALKDEIQQMIDSKAAR